MVISSEFGVGDPQVLYLNGICLSGAKKMAPTSLEVAHRRRRSFFDYGGCSSAGMPQSAQSMP